PELELTAGTISYENTGGDGPVLVLLSGVVMAGSVWESLLPLARGGRQGGEMFAGDSEKGASGGGCRALVPSESSASLQAWTGDLDDRKVGVADRRARQDGDSKSFHSELDERGEFAGFGHNPWVAAGIAAGVLEHGAQTGALGEGDDGLVAQVVKCDGGATGQHVTLMNAKDQRFDGDDAGSNRRHQRLAVEADEGGIEIAVGECPH